jgi:hypothetical protein
LLHGTKVTAAGIDRLRKALPKCKIEWDGGVIDPMAAVPPPAPTIDARWIRLDPPARHDAGFLPRSGHITGNIQSHELAWGRRGSVPGGRKEVR